jgi:hypothetical protein
MIKRKDKISLETKDTLLNNKTIKIRKTIIITERIFETIFSKNTSIHYSSTILGVIKIISSVLFF